VNPVIDMRQADAFESKHSRKNKRKQKFLEVGERNAEEQRYFDEFYVEVYSEMEHKYGPVDEMHVCENIGEHMVGNVRI
jgi:hypothetical protein